MNRPIFLAFLFVFFVAHAMGVWGSLFLPLGAGLIIWAIERDEYSFGEIMAAVGFVTLGAMMGVWTFIVVAPFLIWMSHRASQA